MDINSQTVPEQFKMKPSFVPEGIYGRLFQAFCVIIAPLLGFAISADNSLIQPDWQYEKIRAYPEILLSSEIHLYFSPFLLFSIITFALLLIAPHRFAPNWLIRLGIYSGSILVVHYTILLLFAQVYFLILILGGATGLILFGIVKLGPIALQRWGKAVVRKWLLWAGVVYFFGASILAIFTENPFVIIAPFGWALFGLWMLGLLLPLPIVARLSYRLWRYYEASHFSMIAKVGIGVWLTAYSVQWVNAWLKVEQIYSSLPTDPPDCYIATAAAKGHPRFVKSSQQGAIQVNRQLQTLKVAELLLLALAPKAHAWLRRWYDVYGRILAQKLTHPLLADLAYLTLKPAEWASTIFIRLLIPNGNVLIRQAYKKNGKC